MAGQYATGVPVCASSSIPAEVAYVTCATTTSGPRKSWSARNSIEPVPCAAAMKSRSCGLCATWMWRPAPLAVASARIIASNRGEQVSAACAPKRTRSRPSAAPFHRS